MKPTAKSLYMALIACADDDGVVEAKGVLMMTGTRKTALTELIDYGYVALLERKDLIVWIVGWQSFNTIDVRYGTASYYRRTLQLNFPDIKLLDLKAFDSHFPVGDPREREEKTREEKTREYQSQVEKEEIYSSYDDYDPDEVPFPI